jgi:hypothetical protein
MTPRAAAAEVKETKVTALLKERLATLKAIASQAAEQYKTGRASYTQVHEANQALYRAELDLCETREERVAMLEKMLEEAKLHEKSAEIMFRQAAPGGGFLATLGQGGSAGNRDCAGARQGQMKGNFCPIAVSTG